MKLFFCFSIIAGCQSQVNEKNTVTAPKGLAKVVLQNTHGKYQLLVNGRPFFIKGAGLEFGDIESLANHHGNSFRTWRTENGQKSGREVLDEAHKNGLMVAMGIEVARERHGFDYNNKKAVKEQLERIKKEVIALKDHPALLLWGIGNELNLRYTNPKVWDAVNAISKMIHEVDPNHLTTTSLAGITKTEIDFIKRRCTDIDVLSIQLYGDLPHLPSLIEQCGWDGPYIVSEWGATGHWEVPITDWGAPIEENSTVKATNYLDRYKESIEQDLDKCIGSFVFLWGQKQERTPTWYGVFLEDGRETEAVDVMHYIWSGKWPSHRAPQIKSFTLNHKTAYDNIILLQGSENVAILEVIENETHNITYHWEILHESTDLKDGGDPERRPKAIVLHGLDNKSSKLKFKTPKSGKYRLFVYAEDSYNKSATANIPFLVKK